MLLPCYSVLGECVPLLVSCCLDVVGERWMARVYEACRQAILSRMVVSGDCLSYPSSGFSELRDISILLVFCWMDHYCLNSNSNIFIRKVTASL